MTYAEEIDTLRARVAELEKRLAAYESQEPVAWRLFDGEGGWLYTEDEDTVEKWHRYHAETYADWIEPLFTKATDKVGADTAAYDLSTCPRCGGPADNGHDRCVPPSPYLCTRCTETLQAEENLKEKWDIAVEVARGRMPEGWVPVDAQVILAVQRNIDTLIFPTDKPVAIVKEQMIGGNPGIATHIVEIQDPTRDPLRAGTLLYTHCSTTIKNVRQCACCGAE